MEYMYILQYDRHCRFSYHPYDITKGFLGGTGVKNLPANAGDAGDVCSLDWEDPLEKKTATHSSILAWKNPMDRGAWWPLVALVTVHGITRVTQFSG